MIVLKLDDKALKALFEAGGEEVKVQLQNAVIQNFAKKQFSCLVDKVVNDKEFTKFKLKLEQICSETADKTYKEIQNVFEENIGKIRNSAWGNREVELLDRYKQQIGKIFNNKMSELISIKISELKEILSNNTEYYKDWLDKSIKAEIEKKAKEMVCKAMETVK